MTESATTEKRKFNIRRKKSKNRIWELDFLRGISIVLMCIDHMFFDVASMFQNWEDSSNAFLRSFYHAAIRYIGTRDCTDRIILPDNVMQISDYVFLICLLVFVTTSFLITVCRKTADGQSRNNYLTAVGLSLIMLVSMIVVNNTIGFSLVDGCTLRDFIHPIVLWTFFFLCGLSCRFSRNNIKRTIQIAVCAGLISLFTYLAEVVLDMSGVFVVFGVLHMLATSVFICTIIEIVCKLIFKNENKRKWANTIICLILGIVFYVLNQYLFSVATTVPTIQGLAWFHYVFGSLESDWFALCSSAYIVFFGVALALFVYPKKESLFPKLQIVNKGFFTFMGRHTLIVVLLHQLIIFGILYLINIII